MDEAEVTCRKCWWKSATLWVNAIAAGLVALEAMTGALRPLLPVSIYQLVSIGLPIINAMLRVITTQGLRFRGQ